jgi:hypothetical protein
LEKLNDLQTIKFRHDDEYYRSMIYDINSIDKIAKINPILHICRDTEDFDIWRYFRVYVSSLKMTQLVGRAIRILVKDQLTQKILGIMSLSSDVGYLEKRDEHIGWSNETKFDNKKINHIMNLSTCIPVGNFGYNLNGGKLMAMLAFSKEIKDEFENRYGDKLAGIITTSINGKSIMYDRIKRLKFLGCTKGMGSCHIPKSVYNKCIKYLEDFHNYKRPKKIVSKMIIIQKALNALKIRTSILTHGQQRGVYFGYTGENAKKFLNDEIDDFEYDNVKPASEIISFWKNKWATKRYIHLQQNNRLMSHEDYIENRLFRKGKTKKEKHVLASHKYREKQKKQLGLFRYHLRNRMIYFQKRLREKSTFEYQFKQYMKKIKNDNVVYLKENRMIERKYNNIVRMSNNYLEKIKNQKFFLSRERKEKIRIGALNREKSITLLQHNQILALKDSGLTMEHVGNMFVRSNGKPVGRKIVSKVWKNVFNI